MHYICYSLCDSWELSQWSEVNMQAFIAFAPTYKDTRYTEKSKRQREMKMCYHEAWLRWQHFRLAHNSNSIREPRLRAGFLGVWERFAPAEFAALDFCDCPMAARCFSTFAPTSIFGSYLSSFVQCDQCKSNTNASEYTLVTVIEKILTFLASHLAGATFFSRFFLHWFRRLATVGKFVLI